MDSIDSSSNEDQFLNDSKQSAESFSYFESIKMVVSNKNFTVFLITAWIYSSFNVLRNYFTLYFRDIGISYFYIGLLSSMIGIVILLGELIAGYLADNRDRKTLSWITMAINGLAFLILSMATDIWTVALGFLTIGASSFTGQGGTAYIMEQIDRRFGGVAVSIFNIGTAFGLIPLFAISLLLNAEWEFIAVMRVLLFVAGLAYFVCTAIRIATLDRSPPKRNNAKDTDVLRDFLNETKRGLRLLLRVFPIFIAVMCLDALSDSFYSFATIFYINETLSYGFGDINLMLLLTLLISLPLTLYLGRIFDKRGGRRISIIVYSVMPIAVALLIIAQFIPYVAPLEWRDALDALFPGLSVLFSLAFIATAIKSINDVLWMSVINTYIQKALPRQDLGKMLGLTTVFIMLLATLGPTPAGIIYEIYQGVPLLLTVFVLNIIILVILITKSIEPRISVEELEAEIANDSSIEISDTE